MANPRDGSPLDPAIIIANIVACVVSSLRYGAHRSELMRVLPLLESLPVAAGNSYFFHLGEGDEKRPSCERARGEMAELQESERE